MTTGLLDDASIDVDEVDVTHIPSEEEHVNGNYVEVYKSSNDDNRLSHSGDVNEYGYWLDIQ